MYCGMCLCMFVYVRVYVRTWCGYIYLCVIFGFYLGCAARSWLGCLLMYVCLYVYVLVRAYGSSYPLCVHVYIHKYATIIFLYKQKRVEERLLVERGGRATERRRNGPAGLAPVIRNSRQASRLRSESVCMRMRICTCFTSVFSRLRNVSSQMFTRCVLKFQMSICFVDFEF